jgi:hypothetical protein
LAETGFGDVEWSFLEGFLILDSLQKMGNEPAPPGEGMFIFFAP